VSTVDVFQLMNFSGDEPDARHPRQNSRIFVWLKRVRAGGELGFEHRAATGVRDENLKGRALAAAEMSIEERKRRVLFEPTRSIVDISAAAI